MRTKNRIIAMLLAFVMALGLIPEAAIPGFAVGGSGSITIHNQVDSDALDCLAALGMNTGASWYYELRLYKDSSKAEPLSGWITMSADDTNNSTVADHIYRCLSIPGSYNSPDGRIPLLPNTEREIQLTGNFFSYQDTITGRFTNSYWNPVNSSYPNSGSNILTANGVSSCYYEIKARYDGGLPGCKVEVQGAATAESASTYTVASGTMGATDHIDVTFKTSRDESGSGGGESGGGELPVSNGKFTIINNAPLDLESSSANWNFYLDFAVVVSNAIGNQSINGMLDYATYDENGTLTGTGHTYMTTANVNSHLFSLPPRHKMVIDVVDRSTNGSLTVFGEVKYPTLGNNSLP